MARGDEAAISKILRVAGHVRGGLDSLLRVAETIENGQEQYREKHWGNPGRERVRSMPLPNVSEGVVELGELVAVVYLTKKGDRKSAELVEYEHEFSDHLRDDKRDGTRPILGFAPDGSGLVIVRGPSKYTVTARGIEG